MGIFSFFNSTGMDEYVPQALETEGAVIVDVRTEAEFANGHVKGAVNVPVASIENIAKAVPDKNTPVFVHCASGARSAKAARKLTSMGYTNITDMGGLSRYSGALVKGSR